MTVALKIEPNEVLDLFENLRQAMRWNFYPPCPQPENVIGLEPHSDSGALTILFQNETEGLQVEKDEKWIPIKPIFNAFVVNVGDTLEVSSIKSFTISFFFLFFYHFTFKCFCDRVRLKNLIQT